MFDGIRQAWREARAKAAEQVVTWELNRAMRHDVPHGRLDRLVAYVLAHVAEHGLDSPEGLWWRLHACAALSTRYKRQGDPADLAQWEEITAELMTVFHRYPLPFRMLVLTQRATALLSRYEHSGELADLDAAIVICRELAAVNEDTSNLPDVPELRVMHIPLLGTALGARYTMTGDAADLADSITYLEKSLDIIPQEHEDRCVLMSQLGNALRMRYERFEDPADLDRAVALCQEAANRTDAGYVDAAPILSYLAIAVSHRGRRDRNPADHDAAVVAARRSLAIVTPAHSQYVTLVSHANTVLMSAVLDGDRMDVLDEAIALCRTALDTMPASASTRDSFLTNLGTALSIRYEHSGAEADADAAELAWREVTGLAGATAQVRLDAAQKWGLLAAQRGRWEVALEAYERAVAELPAVAWHGLGRDDQENLLARRARPGLACDAAACALVLGRPQDALRLLEHGRAVLWSRQVTDEAELARLAQHRPDLAEELSTLLAQLDKGVRDTSDAEAEGDPAAVRAQRSRRLAEVLAQILGLDGFETFLAPPSLERIRAALPEDGYAVLVNFSRWRSDALIVSARELRVVPLPRLGFDETLKTVIEYPGALLGAGDRELVSPVGQVQQVEARLDALLRWLWDAVAEPVLEALGLGPREHPADPNGAPRIWWCPTSILTMLPLHAAGYHDAAGRAQGRSVIDRVVSSYTPTLGALVAGGAASPAASSPDQDRLLLVAMPHTPGHGQALTIAEKDVLMELLPAKVTLLEGPEATVDAVRQALDSHDYVHFGCHGKQDLERPSTGGVLLHDGMITVADLVGRRMRGDLAVLAACRTATTGLTNLDEAISFATALRYGGFRHVVATLWSVDDRAAATLSADLFRRLAPLPLTSSRAVADALHATVHGLRDAELGGFRWWVPFVHVGE